MSDDPKEKIRFGLHFDPTFNAGHVFMTIGVGLSLVTWGVRLESRVDHEAELRGRLEQQFFRDQNRDAAAFEEIKQALRRIEDKLDTKADRPR